MSTRLWKAWIVFCVVLSLFGCATNKQSDTSRTGIEQLLISSAVDRSLDKVDLSPIRGAKVFVQEKYLDCVDKNYVIVSMHQRLLANQCTLVEKPEEADVVMEIGSGAVGTDRQEMFVGIPEIPLAPPSPIAIPKLTLYNRARSIGTAKLLVTAYDVKSRQAVLNSGVALARADHRAYTLLGASPASKGTIPQELEVYAGEKESIVPDEVAALKKPLLKR